MIHGSSSFTESKAAPRPVSRLCETRAPVTGSANCTLQTSAASFRDASDSARLRRTWDWRNLCLSRLARPASVHVRVGLTVTPRYRALMAAGGRGCNASCITSPISVWAATACAQSNRDNLPLYSPATCLNALSGQRHRRVEGR